MPTKAKRQHLNKVDEEWAGEDESMFGFSLPQMAIPSLVIVQAGSRMPDKKNHIGEIYNTVTREFYKKAELAFVGWNTPRAVLPFPYNASSPQLCASPNGVEPYRKYIGQEIHAKNAFEELEATIPETCEDCPFAVGLCTQMFRYFGLQLDNGFPFTMRLKRTGMEAARTLNFWLATNERQKNYTTFFMSTEEAYDHDGNPFYKPVFTVGNDASKLLGDAQNLHRALSDRVRRQAQKELAAVNEE